MARIRPLVASVAAWLLGATAALSVGLTALSLIGAGLSDQAVQPLSPHPIEHPLVVPSPSENGDIGVPATAGPSAVSADHTASADQTLSTRGGTVIATCRPTGAYLVGWSPAPGYRAKDVVRGPREVAKLKFDGDGTEIEVSVRCVDGVLRSKIEDEGDGHE